MSKSMPHILLFLIRQSLYQIDLTRPFAGASSVEEIACMPSQTTTQLLFSRLSALKRGRRVLVLWDTAWCQTIDLPAASVTGLKDQELSSALAFEAETFSGLHPEEALCAWRSNGSQGDMTSYTVLQMEVSQVNEIARAFKDAHLKLCGISHPAFLGMPLAEGVNADSVAEAVSTFLRLKNIPVILPPQPPRSEYLPCWIGLTVGIILATGFTCYHLNQRKLLRHYRTGNRVLGNLDAKRSRLNNELKNVRAEIESAKKAFETEREDARKSSLAKGVLSELCDALAESCPPSSMIRSIKSVAPFALRIEGWCSKPKDTEKFFSACARRVEKTGWKLRPEEIVAKHETIDGGPWKFAFTLLHPDQVIETKNTRSPSDEEEDW